MTFEKCGKERNVCMVVCISLSSSKNVSERVPGTCWLNRLLHNTVHAYIMETLTHHEKQLGKIFKKLAFLCIKVNLYKRSMKFIYSEKAKVKIPIRFEVT